MYPARIAGHGDPTLEGRLSSRLEEEKGKKEKKRKGKKKKKREKGGKITPVPA